MRAFFIPYDERYLYFVPIFILLMLLCIMILRWKTWKNGFRILFLSLTLFSFLVVHLPSFVYKNKEYPGGISFGKDISSFSKEVVTYYELDSHQLYVEEVKYTVDQWKRMCRYFRFSEEKFLKELDPVSRKTNKTIIQQLSAYQETSPYGLNQEQMDFFSLQPKNLETLSFFEVEKAHLLIHNGSLAFDDLLEYLSLHSFEDSQLFAVQVLFVQQGNLHIPLGIQITDLPS